MPGYSGTPLPKKLGIKPGFRVHLVNAPAEVRKELRDALAECEVLKQGDALDFAMVFTKSGAELTKEFTRIAKRLAARNDAFWRHRLKRPSEEKNLRRSTSGERTLVRRRPGYSSSVARLQSRLRFARRKQYRPAGRLNFIER